MGLCASKQEINTISRNKDNPKTVPNGPTERSNENVAVFKGQEMVKHNKDETVDVPDMHPLHPENSIIEVGLGLKSVSSFNSKQHSFKQR